MKIYEQTALKSLSIKGLNAHDICEKMNSIEHGEKQKGFYVFLSINGGLEIFIITDKVNKSKGTAQTILKHLGIPCTDENINYIKYKMEYATLQKKKYFIDIFNDYFGGYGDDNTHIIFE